MEDHMRRTILAMMTAVMATAAVAQTKPIVEMISGLPVSGSGGQIGVNIVNLLNEVQNEREYRYSYIAGAQGDAAALRALTLAKSGQDVVLWSGITTFTFNRVTNPTAFDRDRDFLLGTGIGKNTLAVMVNPQSNIRTIDDLVMLIRDRKETFAAATLTSPAATMLNQLFMRRYGIEDRVKTINYKNPGEIILAILNREADYTVFTVPDMTQLRALLVSSDQRLITFPDAPTGKEIGFTDFNLQTILLFSVPRERVKFSAVFESDMRRVCGSPGFEKIARIREPYLSYCMVPQDTIDTVAQENKTINRLYPR
jgi:tripartite-type tricarboxylate transporter receptor subunit TctC